MLRNKETRTIWIALGLLALIGLGKGVYDAYRLINHLPLGNDVPFALTIVFIPLLAVFGWLTRYLDRNPHRDPGR